MSILEDNMVLLYDKINQDKNCGLSCHELPNNPYGIVITRRITEWKHTWLRLGINLFADLNTLTWEENSTRQGLFLYPSNDLDETSGFYNITSVHHHHDNEKVSFPKEINVYRVLNKNKIRSFHRMLSRLEYPYLKEIRQPQCWIQRFRKRRMLQEELLAAVYHPRRLETFLQRGGTRNGWAMGLKW